MRLLVHFFLLCLALCVASSRWRHRKKNAILDWRRTLMSRGILTSSSVTRSRLHRPIKKSIVRVSEITPDGDPCALGPTACHRYSEIINANAETREPHNLDKAERDLLRSPSYRDLPKETAERIKALMEERIKMLSSNESSTSDETKSDSEKEPKTVAKEEDKSDKVNATPDMADAVENLKRVMEVIESGDGQTNATCQSTDEGSVGCKNLTQHEISTPYNDTAISHDVMSPDIDTIKVKFSDDDKAAETKSDTSPHNEDTDNNKENNDKEKEELGKEKEKEESLFNIASDLNLKTHDADDDQKSLPDLSLTKSKPKEVTPIRENFAEGQGLKDLNKSGQQHPSHHKVPFNPKKRAFSASSSSNKTEPVVVQEHFTGDPASNIIHYSLYTTSVRGLLPLPPLEELVDLNDKQMKYKHNGCDIKVTNVQCIMELNLRSKKCENVVSLPSLYDTLTRGSLKRSAEKFINLDVFQVSTVTIDRCKKDITFETVAKEPFNFLSGVEGTKVLDATLALDFNYEGPFGFEQLGFKVTGESKVDGDTWLMSLIKARGMSDGKFSIDASKIKVSDFYKLFSNGAELDRNTALDVRPFTDVTIDDPKVRGIRDSKGTDEIVVSGNFKEIAGMGEASLFIVVERKAFKPVSVAVTFNPHSIEPASVLYNLVGVNLKEVPLLSGVRMGMVVEYSNNDIEKPSDTMLVRSLLKYVSNAQINKGTRIKVIAPVRDILKYKGIRTPKIHDTYIQMLVQEDVIKFKFPEDPLMDLSQILVALVPSVPEVLFKKILVNPPQIKISKYDVDIKMKNTSAIIEAPTKFPLGNNLIEVDSARFDLKHQDGKPWEFSLKAKKKIGMQTMDLSIKKESDQFVLAGSGVDVTIKQLIDSFNVKAGVAEIIKEAPYLNFDIKDMKLSAQFGGKQKIMLHGFAEFLKDKAVFEGALMEFPSKTSLSIGLVLNDVSLDELGAKMFKDYKPIRGAGWLSGLTASIVSSNSDSVKDITFANEILKENKIVELLESPLMKQCYQFEELETRVWYPWKDKASCHTGVSFGAKVKLPTDCQGESICNLLSKNFGTDRDIYLKGVISSAVLQLKTTLSGHIVMNDDLQIRDVAVLLSVGKQNMISVNGKMKMKLDNKDFDFEASVGYNPTGRLELILNMDSVFEKPLGLSFVSLAGLNMDAGIDRADNLKPHFELNGKMLLGVLGDQMATDISGALDNNNNGGSTFYFFSRLKEPSLARLKRAFGIKSDIPRVLQDTSFQGEVIVGSTSNPNGTTIPFMEVELSQGLFFRGLFNIFGFSIKSQIEVTNGGKMALRGLLPKMDLADGLIKVKNADDKAAGLGMGGELAINVDNQGSSVVIDGVVDLLDMTSPTRMEISDKGMEMVVNGRYLNMIDARIIVNAPNGKLLKIPESKFMASSCLESVLPYVSQSAKELVEEGVKITADASKEVKKQIENAAVWLQKASSKHESIQSKVHQMEEKVREKSSHFEAMKKVLDDRCVDRCRPNRTWVGGFDEREYTFAGKKIKCPTWKEKRRLRYAPGCLIICEGNKIIEKSNAVQKKVAISILRKLTKTQSVVLDTVQSFVDAAKNVVEMTEQSSRKVSEISTDGKRASDYIKNFGADNIFSINKICFGTTLKVANEGCMMFSVDVNFGGKNGKHYLYDTETTCLNRNYANSLAEQIVYFNKFFPGLKNIKEKIAQTKASFKKGEDEAAKLETKYKEVLESELEVDSKTKSIIRKSALNPMDDIGEELNELPELPPVVLRNDNTMKAFRDMFSDEDDVRDVTADDNDEGDNEGSGDENLFAKVDVTIDINELQKSTADKCTLIDNVINAYANIGNGAIILSDHNQNEKDKYQGFLGNITQEVIKANNLVTEACIKANLTSGETNDALFYAIKSKEDIQDYERWLQHKFDLLDKSSLGSWRSLMSDMVADKGIELTSFLKILNSVSVEAARRHDVPNTKYQLGESLRYAEKIVNDLLLGDDDTLSSKRESIKDLQDQVMYMKQVKKEMDCKA